MHAPDSDVTARLIEFLLTIIAEPHVTARELFSSSIKILADDSITASRLSGSNSMPLSLVTIIHPSAAQ